MASIRRIESGSFRGNYYARNKNSGAFGAYQFLPKYWDWYARSAGYPGADIRDRLVQDEVARWHMTRLFNKYRNWDLVAIAWHGGEGRIPQYNRGVYHASDGYIDKMRRYMPQWESIGVTANDVSADRRLAQRTRPRPQTSPAAPIEGMYADQPPPQQVQQQVIDAEKDLLAQILGLLDEGGEPEPVDEAAVMRRNLATMLTSLSNGLAGGNRLNVGAQVEVPTLQMDQATTGEGD